MRKSVKIALLRGAASKMNGPQPVVSGVFAYLGKAEVERFFAAIPAENPRDRLLFDLMYRHGLRRLEVGLLRREHLSDGRIWITRVKGGISGEYPVHPMARRLLWDYLSTRDDENPHLFPSRQDDRRPLSASMIYHLFRGYAESAELPEDRRHPHVL